MAYSHSALIPGPGSQRLILYSRSSTVLKRPDRAIVIRINYAGFGKIAGTVKVKGSPDFAVHRRVRLFRDRDGVCLGETWSDATTGAYQFLGVDPAERYTVLAYDYTHTFRVAAADNVQPELMT